jgi:hypothetical protein
MTKHLGSRKTHVSGRLSLVEAYGGGWCATLDTGDEIVRRFYGPRGGEWELSSNGVEGRQLVGTCDIRVSAQRDRARRQIRSHLAYLVH